LEGVVRARTFSCGRSNNTWLLGAAATLDSARSAWAGTGADTIPNPVSEASVNARTSYHFRHVGFIQKMLPKVLIKSSDNTQLGSGSLVSSSVTEVNRYTLCKTQKRSRRRRFNHVRLPTQDWTARGLADPALSSASS